MCFSFAIQWHAVIAEDWARVVLTNAVLHLFSPPSFQVESFVLHFWKGLPTHLLPVLPSAVAADLVALCDSTLYHVITSVLIVSPLQTLPERCHMQLFISITVVFPVSVYSGVSAKSGLKVMGLRRCSLLATPNSAFVKKIGGGIGGHDRASSDIPDTYQHMILPTLFQGVRFQYLAVWFTLCCKRFLVSHAFFTVGSITWVVYNRAVI